MSINVGRATPLVFLMSAVLLGSAVQGKKFPGGLFRTSDGTSSIAVDFDTTGTFTVYVNNEVLSNGKWEAKADTLTIGAISGPEGYACTSSAKYQWAIDDKTLSFKLIGNDDCASRRDPMLGLVWTRG